ncbi:MAG: energy transducer TonB [Muribaculaceae bacterium]|nr:energy transducer TonB [Muribaculaceae bacterium]MDE7350029.1 energy transducer TonB [Muribaculaceae bacterium]
MKKILSILASLSIAATAMAQTAQSDTIPASFPGGEKAMSTYIQKNLKYPQPSINNGIEGVVNVKFIVKTDGALDKLSIVRLVDPDLEAEAMRLVKGMPAWNPATVAGTPVDSESNVEVVFTLPE